MAQLIADSFPNRDLNARVERLTRSEPEKRASRLVRRANSNKSGIVFVIKLSLYILDLSSFNIQDAFGWPMIELDPEITVSESDVDDFPITNNLNGESISEGSGMGKFQVDASVISEEEGYDDKDQAIMPPLSRIVFLR
jgi:hypothetical protein